MNSASRLHTIIQFFNSADPNASINTAWEKYLGPASNALTEEDVLTVIQAVLAEIRSMEVKLRSIGVPDNLFHDCVSQLRTGFSPTQLAVPWKSHHEQMLKRATPLALQWAAWTLSQFDENEIDEMAMKSLRDSLDAQEMLLQETDLPVGLREMLERQTAGLRRALQFYKIQGIGPVQKVVSDSIGELATAPQDLVTEVETSPSAVKQAFEQGKKMIGKAAEFADKGSKVIKFGSEVYKLGVTGLQLGQSLLTTANPT
ncbi:hypothetical protein [Rhodoferax sp. UBA5149]|uniref:hypothetical protein n=1 Tax=Rhodoferax sp. UBA5149 TaxID=1947379 RepID=UPI0025E0DA83|nr:hypothetical protein [Rhodoferax sp. UBA5149]